VTLSLSDNIPKKYLAEKSIVFFVTKKNNVGDKALASLMLIFYLHEAGCTIPTVLYKSTLHTAQPPPPFPSISWL
jgi:hypothetical protein